MRGRRVYLLVVLLSVFLVASLVFATGIVDVSKLLSGGASEPTSSSVEEATNGATVFVNVTPVKIIKDYWNDPGYRRGDTFTIHVNVTNVSDLFAWEVNMTWNKLVLNVSRITRSEFLARSPNYTSSEVLNATALGNSVINSTNYAQGWASIAEAVMGNVSGVSGSGRLVSIQFRVVSSGTGMYGYGCSDFTLSLVGSLRTRLLNSSSTSNAISFTRVNGFFKNKVNGDSNGDGTVNVYDLGTVSGRWTGAPGALPYSRCMDNNDDGVFNVYDLGITSGNWGRSGP